MKKFICTICGYVYEGEAAPEVCPQCKAPASKFVEKSDEEMSWADEHRIGVAKDIDERVIEGLNQNFMGECTEVGMYLAKMCIRDRLTIVRRFLLVFFAFYLGSEVVGNMINAIPEFVTSGMAAAAGSVSYTHL